MRKKNLFKVMAITCITSMFLLVGCGNKADYSQAQNESNGAKTEQNVGTAKGLPIATIEVEGYGKIVAELYPQYAPNTVNNFISLANEGFYNGLTFHRVIMDFVLQGGDPNGNGSGGPGYKIKGEFAENGYKDNTLTHDAGVLSMARTNRPDTAGSQFFIVTQDSERNRKSLDEKYAGFGKVIDGMDVVTKISEVKTDGNDKPIEPVVIKSITVDTKGIEYREPEKM